MMTTTMDLNGFNSSISGGIIGGLHLDKMGMASETDDLLDVWDSDLQQVRTIFKIICSEIHLKLSNVCLVCGYFCVTLFDDFSNGF